MVQVIECNVRAHGIPSPPLEIGTRSNLFELPDNADDTVARHDEAGQCLDENVGRQRRKILLSQSEVRAMLRRRIRCMDQYDQADGDQKLVN